jgi:hypothetical protein
MAEEVLKLVDDTSNTGKKVRGVSNTVGADTVVQQVVTLADSASNLIEGSTAGLPVKHFAAAESLGTHTGVGSVAVSAAGHSAAVVEITGTYDATLTVEGSADGGTTYYPLRAMRLGGDGFDLGEQALVNVGRAWLVNVAGLTHVRSRCTAYTSGTANVRVMLAAAPLPAVAGAALLGVSGGNGLSKGKTRNLAGTATAVKASAGVLYGLQIANTQGAAAYVQLFDLATGSVTPGTTTPDMEFLVAATSQKEIVLPPQGVPFSTAITILSATATGGGTGSAAGVHAHYQYA